MKVNFKNFPIYTSIRRDKKRNADISEGLANAIYMNIGGVAAKSLALRIYESEEIELSEKEIGIITKLAEGLVGIMADSLLDYFKDKEL